MGDQYEGFLGSDLCLCCLLIMCNDGNEDRVCLVVLLFTFGQFFSTTLSLEDSKVK